MFKTIVSLLLVVLSWSVLEVYGPKCAKDRFGSSIQYTLSNFGEIPYGQSIVAQMQLPNSPTLCSIDD